MKFISIKKKLIGSTLIITVLAVLITVGPALLIFSKYTDKVSQEQAIRGMEGLNTLLEDYKKLAISSAVLFASNPELVKAVQNKDTVAILGLLSPLLSEAKVDFVTITDEKGNVLARTHDPGKKGDSVASQANVAQALTGKAFAAIEPGTVSKLSAMAGVPVRDYQGNVIGVISVGYYVDRENVVDAAKNMFATDCTLFLGDVRVTTTIEKEGKRAVGTKLDPKIAELVLVKGERYISNADILGKDYITAYMPLIGPDNKPMGIVFAGQSIEEGAAARNSAILTIAVILAVVMAIVIFVTTIIARRITRPVQHLLEVVDKVAAGDLTQEVKADSNDEIGLLANDFNKMVDQLKGLVAKVNILARAVADSSEELTASADQAAQVADQTAASVAQVASGAEEQSTAINGTSEFIEQMSASIEEIAANAGSVAGMSETTAVAAQEGGAVVNKVVAQMTTIEKTVEESAQVVAQLGQRSQAIGQIVETIASIAGQTNLLALNAAIEAAHAGEHGRGFAVVADEVRKLAEQSQEAAMQVAKLVTEVQDDTAKAVQVMTLGTVEVKNGTKVVQQAGDAFAKINELVKQVSAQVLEISAATQQIAGGSQHVVISIKDIDLLSRNACEQTILASEATESQLAFIEEIASASQSLLRLTQDLHDSVSSFKV